MTTVWRMRAVATNGIQRRRSCDSTPRFRPASGALSTMMTKPAMSITRPS